ncbi:MAG: signal peptidase I, partial [Clostridiaceae bacterium]|nr:signal peptidase I [Clostridiaceae bacterium]
MDHYEQEDYEVPTTPQKEPFWRRLLRFALTLAICFILVYVITQFVLQRNTVIGSSMSPTLEDRDEVFVEKITRLFPSGLRRGDIVTADSFRDLTNNHEIMIIKRIIGLPGERITIRGGFVFIDGQQLDEPYLEEGMMTSEHSGVYADILLGDNEYYLLGDNRMNSRDSRDVGPFHEEDIVGSLILRFFP